MASSLPTRWSVDDGGWLAVESGGEIAFLEGVTNIGDLGQNDPGTVVAGEYHDVFELFSPVGLTFGAQQNVTAFRFQGATRHVQRGVANDA